MGGSEPSSRPVRPSGLPLVIGVGNEHRGDDAFGILVARRLRTLLEGLGEVLERETEGTELIDLWAGRERVWVVDAIRAGGAPGSLYRIEVGAEALPTPLAVTSSHGISLGQAVSLAQVLRRLPGQLVIHGVEPAQFDAGERLSPSVAPAVPLIVRRIEEEVRRASATEAAHPGREGSHA